MSPPIQAWLNAEEMDRGYMLRAMPMSVRARFTVSSSGALSRARRRAALTRTAAFPHTDRTAAGQNMKRESFKSGISNQHDFSFEGGSIQAVTCDSR